MNTAFQIGLIGGGKMATNIAEYLISFELSVVWYIRSETVLNEKRSYISKRIKRISKISELTDEQLDRKLQSVKITHLPDELANVDFIIECISEDSSAKCDLFKKLEKLIQHHTIILSNTSSLPLDIFLSSELQKRSAGLHFFYPVQLKKYVELNIPDTIDLQYKSRIIEFIKYIDKVPLELTKQNWFALNRIFLPYLAQVAICFKQFNLTLKEIDDAIGVSLFPTGPFTFMKSVGYDVMKSSVEQYRENSNNKMAYTALTDLLNELSVQGTQEEIDLSDSPIVKSDSDSIEKTVQILKAVFINTFYTELAKKYTDQSILEDVVAEYAGLTDSDIDKLIRNTTPDLLDTLKSWYTKTYWDIYKPALLLAKNMKVTASRTSIRQES